MNCNCFSEIDLLNEKEGLDLKGLRQSTDLNISDGKSSLITRLIIDCVKRGTNRKANRFVILNYCPFCGLPKTEQAERAYNARLDAKEGVK